MGVTPDPAPHAVVVDDSRFMRTLIRTILEEGGIDVVAQASDGKEAVETVATEVPDVVTMDIEMPGYDGLDAVTEIMRTCPTPVLMLSAHAEAGADVTFEALDRGAVDFVTKPGGEVSSEMPRVKRTLVEKVRSVATADVTAGVSVGGDAGGPPDATRGRVGADAAVGHGDGTAVGYDGRGAGELSRADLAAAVPDGSTLVIGASTGGPTVVERVLCALPAAAKLRVLVVQHMPDGFTSRFADRLDGGCDYRVREARDGERVGSGEARVAPGGRHLRVTDDRATRLRIELGDDDPIHGVRPAVDHAMTSAASAVKTPLAAVLLTGMGADGVAGMRAVRHAGGHTLAQDEQTSAIFGMPKRAIEAGVVDGVLPAPDIADGVLRALAEV